MTGRNVPLKRWRITVMHGGKELKLDVWGETANSAKNKAQRLFHGKPWCYLIKDSPIRENPKKE